MRVENVWITGTGASIAPRVPIRDAVERGEYARDEAERTQQTAVAVGPPDRPAASYAVAAGFAAMRQAGDPEPGLLVHCVVYGSGCEWWTAAPHVQQRLQIADAVPVDLHAGCNPLIAWELAIGQLYGPAGYDDALITASDTWHLPRADRYTAASGFVLGDGGGAVCLARKPGIARVLSLRTAADTALEALTRGAHPMHGVSPTLFDLRARAAEFMYDGMTKAELWRRRDVGMARTVRRALDDADESIDGIARIVTNHVGRELLQREVLSVIGAPIERTTWEYGRMIGHLGAADAAVSLRHVLETPGLRRGERVLVICTAAGYTWGAAVLELEKDSGPSGEGAAE